jgi:hypothetical protein
MAARRPDRHETALDGTADELAAWIETVRAGAAAWHAAVTEAPELMRPIYTSFEIAWLSALAEAVGERERRDAAAAGVRQNWSLVTRYPDGTSTEALGSATGPPVVLRDWPEAATG